MKIENKIGFDAAGIIIARQLIALVPHTLDSVWAYLAEALDEIERLRARVTGLKAKLVEACDIANDLNGDNGDDEELLRRRNQISAIRAEASK